MEPTNIAWQENQRRSFCSESSMTASIDSDTISPVISAQNVVSLSYTKAGDILSGTLTQDKLTLQIKERYDEELRWLRNLVPDKLRNARISFSPSFKLPGYDGYYNIRGGTYFITDITKAADGKSATIQAESILSFMTSIIETEQNNAADYVFSNLVHLANLDDAVPASTLTAIMDTDAMHDTRIQILPSDNLSIAQGLQLIANACGCTLYVGRGGYDIHCEPYSRESVNYVLSDKIMYQQLETKYSDLIGNISIITDHSTKKYGTNETGEKIGARQIITNPVLITNNIPPSGLMQYIFQTLNYSRKKFTASVRLDPALDLFDAITIPNGDSADIAVVTKISATYNGAWKGTIEASTVDGTGRKLRICDLEMMTLAQIEALQIKNCAPEGD